MSRIENLKALVRDLIAEDSRYAGIQIPDDLESLQNLLRALMNVRAPHDVADDLLARQDEELATQREEKGVVTLSEIPPSPVNNRLRMWQGDITRLEVDAIVNAANSQMLGCFVPLHRCIDNAIHSAAGMELREECNRIMHEQGHDEPTGKAKITHGYNLPAKWVIHTVGPIVYGDRPTARDCRLLADCYKSCLDLASDKNLESIAFCCISTGEFHFPNDEAARIAVKTVEDYLNDNPDCKLSAIVFDVFKDEDYNLYRKLLGYG